MRSAHVTAFFWGVRFNRHAVVIPNSSRLYGDRIPIIDSRKLGLSLFKENNVPLYLAFSFPFWFRTRTITQSTTAPRFVLQLFGVLAEPAAQQSFKPLG
jgi:hypothetical protein